MKLNYQTMLRNAGRIIALLILTCIAVANTQAQVANYAFSQVLGTYTPITGGTVLASGAGFWDDDTFGPIPIGFTFNYNATNYTDVSIAANGYIKFGTVAPYCCNYNGTSVQNETETMHAFSEDLLGNTATCELSYLTTGTPGSQIFTIQWSDWGFYSSGSAEINFQVKLYEGTNIIEFAYSPATIASFGTCQVGLTGTTVADFNSRTTTTDWTATTASAVNTAQMTFNTTVFPPSGLSYFWTLAALDMGPLTLATPLPNTCYTASETVTIRIKNFGTALIDFSVDPVTVSASSTNTNPQVFPPVLINSGTLASNATLDVVVSGSYNMSAQGVYTFIASTSVAGDGNPGNDNMGPVSLPVYPPVSATATPISICLGQNTQLSTPPGQVTYAVAPIPYAPLTPAGPVTVLENAGVVVTPMFNFTNLDDGTWQGITIPFGFDFYGNTFTTLSVSTNGFIGLGDLNGATGCCTGQVLPNAFAPNNVIAISWEDLNANTSPSPTGTIDYFVNGIAPFRQFVVRFTNIFHYFTAVNPIDGQIVLNESSNTIELHITSFGTDNDGVGETQGIENGTGTLATVVPGRNSTDPWSATNEGWIFTPSVPFTFVWNPATWLSNNAIYNPVLTPLATGPFTYTVTATDPSSGCTSTSSVTVTVVAVPSSPISSNVTQCGTGSATLTATAVGGGTLQWFDQPTGGPMLGTGTIFVTPIVSTTTNYYVEEYDGNCSGPRTTVTVIVTPPPSVTITSSQPSICGFPASVTITLTASSSNLSYTYTWTGNDLNSTTGSSVTATPLATNTYVVFATDGGCSTTDTITIPLTPYPIATATATPNPDCQGQPTLLNTPPGQVTYSVAPISYAPLTPTGPVTVLESAGVAITPMYGFPNLDDGTWQGITIPFNFDFYGNTFTTLSVSTNGFIGLGDLNGATGCCTGQILPNAFAPNNVIAISWEDLNANTSPSPSGTIDYFVNGTAPFRQFVVRFTNIFHYFTAINPIDGQIVLNESSNTIELHITSFATDNDGVGETQGIEDGTGTLATTVPGRNSTDPWLATNEGWIFTPISQYTFVWNPATWLSTPTVYNPVLTPLSTGNFTYNVTVTDVVSGCTSTSSVTVSVVNVPSAPLSSNVTRCGTGTVTLTATAIGSGTLQWWDAPTGGTMVGTGSPITLGPLSSSTTFYVEEYDGACPGPRTAVIVTVTPADTVTVASTANPMCAGNSVTLTMTSLNPGYNYTWSPAIGLSSTTGNSVTANPPFSVTYTINAIDGAGCQSSTTINLTVNPSPVIIAPSATPAVVCAGSNSQLDVSYVVPPTNYIVSSIPYAPLPSPVTNAALIPTSFWAAGDEGLTAPISIGFNFNFFGNSYSTLSISSNGHLQFTPYPTFSTYGPFGVPIPTVGIPEDYIALCWSDLDQSSGGTITYGTIGTSPNQKFIVEYSNVAFYFSTGTVSGQIILDEATSCIEIHVTQINNTTNEKIMGIENSTGTIGAAPPAYNQSVWSITTPEAWQFCPQIPYLFSWTPPLNLNNPAISNPVASPTATTTYTVSITDPTFNCTSSATVIVNVYPLPVVTLASLSDICVDGSPLSLTGGTPSGGTYSGIGVSNNTFYPSVSGIGTFTITYLYTDGNGCSGTDTTQITVNPLPVVTMPTFPVICETSYPVNLSTGAPGGGNYSGPGVTSGVFDPSVTGDGIFGITYTYTDANGCTNSAYRNITVNESPAVSAGADILGNSALNGSATGGTPPYTYVWYPCLSLSNCNTPNPVATPAVNTFYVLVVIDANGCYSSDTVLVTSTVGIATTPSQNVDFLIYPNPSSGVYNILFINSNDKADITVTDIIGQQVFSSGSITAPSQPYQLDLTSQPDGMYLMQVKYKDRIFTTRLVLNK